MRAQAEPAETGNERDQGGVNGRDGNNLGGLVVNREPLFVFSRFFFNRSGFGQSCTERHDFGFG